MEEEANVLVLVAELSGMARKRVIVSKKSLGLSYETGTNITLTRHRETKENSPRRRD